MRHQAECKLDNKLRLKQVKNLDELIHFRISTVNGHMAENGNGLHPGTMHKKELSGLRRVIDPLLSNDAFLALSPSAASRGDLAVDEGKSMEADSLMQENLLAHGPEHGVDERSEQTAALDGLTLQEIDIAKSGKVDRKILSETGTILLERKSVAA